MSKKLPSLETLILDNTSITDNGVALYLTEADELLNISFSGTNITDKTIEKLLNGKKHIFEKP